MSSSGPGLDDLVEATPAGRDRVVDLVRAASILAVVLGHWLVAAAVRVDGELETTNALAELRWLRPLTWVFQVMPLFFVVGGFANFRSLRAPTGASGASASWAGFLARRADRLLRPTLVFAGVWLVLAAALGVLVSDDELVTDVGRVAAQPLWFLAVYVLVVLVAPAQQALHDRAPRLVLVVGPLLVVGLDATRFHELAGDLGYLNYLAVFVVAQELGFWYAEGSLGGISLGRSLTAAGAAALVLVALTVWGPYPVSMIGLPGSRISNMSPPTVCILLLAVIQGAAVMAVHEPLQRWLQRPGVWRPVVAMNVVVLTVFLWHLSALVAVGSLVLAFDLSLPAIGTAAWWVQRFLWVGAAAAVLVAVVAALSPLERLPARAVPPGPAWLRVAGLLAAALGLTGFALAGFAHPFSAAGRDLMGVRAAPAVAALLLAGGWLAATGPPRWSGSDPR